MELPTISNFHPPRQHTNLVVSIPSVEFGTIMLWFFVADRTRLLEPTGKEYVRDRFAFIFLTLLLVAGWSSTTKVKVPTLLNRQQTEEWKGWMQVRRGRVMLILYGGQILVCGVFMRWSHRDY